MTTVPAAGEAEPMAERFGRAYPWLITATVLSAFLNSVFTSSVVNVAVPDVMGAFGAGQDHVQFLATAFFATMTASLLLNPWIVPRLGPRLTFSLCLVLFAVGSLVCAFSPALPAVILGRVAQGFAAGVLQPLVMVLLVQAFPPERRGTAMALFGMGIVVAHGIGPWVGGLTIDYLNWRMIFIVPLPVLLFSFVMGLFFLPRRQVGMSRGGEQFDLAGFLMLCVALFCLMTAIANGQRDGWVSDHILLTFAIGLSAAAGFVVSQLRSGTGLMDMTLFRNPQFAAAIGASLVYGLTNFTAVYLYPIFGQLVQNYTPTAAGFLVLPGTLIAALTLPLAGRFADVSPPWLPIALGMLVFAASNLALAGADVNTTFLTVVMIIFVGRIGLSLMTPAMTAAALGALSTRQLNQGAAIVNFVMLGGGAFGINGLVVILDRRTQFHSEALAATQTAGNPATIEMLDFVHRLLGEEGFSEALRSPVALKYLGEVVHAQANTLGFQDGFMAIAIVTLLGLLPAAVLHVLSRRRSGNR